MILAISVHWYISDTAVTGSPFPKTIHDFGGFPPELYNVIYPAPGILELARKVQKLLAPLDVRFDEQRGLDHGAWSVLCHLFPDADIPVVQLSIDETMSPEFHYDTGRLLQPLRNDGILIAGSGNLAAPLYTWFAERT